MPGALSPKTKGARTYRTRMQPRAHSWDAVDEIRVEGQSFTVECSPGASRSSGRLDGAVLIRLETDVGGRPKSLKSWRVGARGGSRKKRSARTLHPPPGDRASTDEICGACFTGDGVPPSQI